MKKTSQEKDSYLFSFIGIIGIAITIITCILTNNK